jgi:hypothetical protein
MNVKTDKSWCAGWFTLGLLLAGGVAAMYAVAIWFGALNQDEGWYLYAGRLVHEGRHPFRDFASTQGPVMAYLYSLAWPLVRVAGVAGGRLFTALLGALTIALAARLAYRLVDGAENASTTNTFSTGFAAFEVPPSGGSAHHGNCAMAALLAAGLLGLNLYHVYFTSLVKTYGAAGLLTVLGFCGLAGSLRSAQHTGHAKRTFLLAALAAAAFGIAAGTRLSAGVLLPATWLPLAICCWRTDAATRQRLLPLLAGMLAGGTLALAAVYGPFLLSVPDALAFGLLDYHAARQVGSTPVLLVYKAGFLLRLCTFYFPVLVVGAIGLAGWLHQRGHEPAHPPPFPSLPPLLWSGLVAVTLVHLAAPFPYDDYQAFIMPCAVLLVAPAAARLLRRLPLSVSGRLAVVAGMLALMLAHSLSSPLLQIWLVDGRNRIWWPLKTRTALQGLREAATTIRTLGGDNGDKVLLTQDTYLAVEAGWRVPAGMELGPFCFFPGLGDEDASRLHVLNENRYLDLIAKSDADIAAFSDWGLAIRAPEIVPVETNQVHRLQQALESHYSPVRRIDNFGQGETPLHILKRRTLR